MEINVIASNLQHLSYFGVFLWFSALSPVVPVFEEVVLITIGYLSAIGLMNPFFAAVVAIFSMALADNTFFFLSSSGSRFFKRFIKKKKPKIFIKFENKMRKNMPKTILVLTFIPRVRFFGPIIAGIVNVIWFQFFLFDLLALTTYVTIYVSLGYFFYNKLNLLLEQLKVNIIFIIFIILFLVVFIYWFKKLKLNNPNNNNNNNNNNKH